MEQQSEITVAGNAYRCGKLNAMQQFHITRRLGPMLVVAGISVEMLRGGMKMELDDLVAMSGPVMELLSRMSDADTEYIIHTSLSAVKRKQGTDFAPVLAQDGKTIVFMDLDMPSMIRLVIEVLKVNLGNFSMGLGEELPSQSS